MRLWYSLIWRSPVGRYYQYHFLLLHTKQASLIQHYHTPQFTPPEVIHNSSSTSIPHLFLILSTLRPNSSLHTRAIPLVSSTYQIHQTIHVNWLLSTLPISTRLLPCQFLLSLSLLHIPIPSASESLSESAQSSSLIILNIP